MKEKFPEMTIPCPACNDREHRMTIEVDKASSINYSVVAYFISCDKCGARFKLVRTKIIERPHSTSETTPSVMPW